MNNHTYLFQTGTWLAKGTYYDAENQPIPVEGESRIIHENGHWINDSSMKLLIETPVELKNRYTIEPFEAMGDVITWESQNPALGQLAGKFMVVDDSILSRYHSKDGLFTGLEYMLKVSDRLYQSRGFAFRGDEKLSSWGVVLWRIQ